MRRIGEDVRRQVRRFGPAGSIGEIVEAWPAAVGDAIARNAWPARVASDGTLHVSTASSAWAFELSQLAPTILERLAEAVGEYAPKAARFAVGRLPEPATVDAFPHLASEPRHPGRHELETARSLAAKIDDEELRELVARAAAASLARSPSDRRF